MFLLETVALIKGWKDALSRRDQMDGHDALGFQVREAAVHQLLGDASPLPGRIYGKVVDLKGPSV